LLLPLLLQMPHLESLASLWLPLLQLRVPWRAAIELPWGPMAKFAQV
jgi:hypothetical protein